MTPPEPDTAATGPAAARRRTHPVTPLVTGWKLVVGIIAVLTAQNVARLLEDFTLRRALIGLAVVAVAVVIAIVASALRWWSTTYAVDDDGVSLHRGLISRSREYAPRARIESVSVERPLLARLLGLAKVRVEFAGGGESSLDIEYVRSSEAEQLRRSILGVAARTAPAIPGDPATSNGPTDPAAGSGRPAPTDPAGPAAVGVAPPAHGTAARTVASAPPPVRSEQEESAPGAPAAPSTPHGPVRGALQDFLDDGVADGELIAQIPTARLVRSLLRDLGFLLGVVTSILGVLVAIGLALWQDGLSFAVVIALLPTAIAVPKYVFGRIESGWGFVSRITERGLRMRRGLANTRTDNIASGRIQRIELRRPLLWRGPGWTAATVTVAGLGDAEENGAENVLPVGTREELRATLGHLAAPLGTPDDLQTIEHLLTAPAREIEGLRTEVRAYWIDRRTRVSVLLPGALVRRTGVLTRRVEIVPRERIQQLAVDDDPFSRRLGTLDLHVGVAGHTMTLDNLPRREALALHGVLARDAATLRRRRDLAQGPGPARGPCPAPAGQPRAMAEGAL